MQELNLYSMHVVWCKWIEFEMDNVESAYCPNSIKYPSNNLNRNSNSFNANDIQIWIYPAPI